MIMGEDYAGAVLCKNVCNDVFDLAVNACFVSHILHEHKAILLSVQMRHPQAFPQSIGIGHASLKESPRVA
jgi:hypothetical protein